MQKHKKIKLANSLSKCVNYVQSTHFKGFEAVMARTSMYDIHYEMRMCNVVEHM